MENYDKYKDLLEVSENSEGTAERKYQSYKESYASAKSEFTATFERFVNGSEVINLMTDLVNIGTKTINWLEKYGKLIPYYLGQIAVYRAATGKGFTSQAFRMMGRNKPAGGNTPGGATSGVMAGTIGRGINFTNVARRIVSRAKYGNLTKDWYDYTGQKRVPEYGKKTTPEAKEIKEFDEFSKLSPIERTRKIYEKKKSSLNEEKEKLLKTVKDEKISMGDKAKIEKEIKKIDKEIAKNYKRSGLKKFDKRTARKQEKSLKNATKNLNKLRNSGIFSEEEQNFLNAKISLENNKELKESLGENYKKDMTNAEAISLLNSGKLNKNTAEQLSKAVYETDATKDTASGVKTKINQAGGLKKTGVSKGQVAMAAVQGLEVIAAMATTAYTTYKTAGTSHTSHGETVQSSKQAQKAAGSAAAAWSTLPLIGGIIGQHAADKIAKRIDKDRDEANYRTKRANELLNSLTENRSDFEKIMKTEAGSTERHKLIEEMKKKLYDPSNKELKKNLEAHLGGKSIDSLLKTIGDNTKDSAETIKTMKEIQIAQLQLERSQLAAKYAATAYEKETEMNRTSAYIDGYSGKKGSGKTYGKRIGQGALGGTLTGAASGAMIGSIFGPIGTGIGAAIGAGIGAIAGAILGGTVATKEVKAVAYDKQSKYTRSSNWNTANTDEKIQITKEDIEKAEQKYSEIQQNIKDLEEQKTELQEQYKEDNKGKGYITTYTHDQQKELDELDKQIAQAEKSFDKQYKKLSKYYSLEKQLKEYKAFQNQMWEESLELVKQEAFVGAQFKDTYLSEMTLPQLNSSSIDEILIAYAKQLESIGGLSGYNIWADQDKTKLSKFGYDYLYEALKSQGDEEIESFLSGKTMTLDEVLKLSKDEIGTQKLREVFKDALGATDEFLDELSERFGKLTLSELNLSPDELIEKTKSVGTLLGSITSGAGQVSEWMATITNQFPQLISYMGDTSKLLSEATVYMTQLSDAYMNSQFDLLASSGDLFKTFKEDFFEALDDGAEEELKKSKNLSNINDIRKWVQTNKNSTDKDLKEYAQQVEEALLEIAATSGVKVVNTILKSYYDQLIEFETKSIDKEIENLNSQKSALGEIIHQREYENKLIEAKLKLEDASKQKKRIYRAGVGWVYESDQEAIESAQKELKELDYEKQADTLETRIKYLEGEKTALNQIYDNANYETQAQLFADAIDKGTISGELSSMSSTLSNLSTGTFKNLDDWLKEQLASDQEKHDTTLKDAKDAWEVLLQQTPGTEDYNAALRNFHKAMATAVDEGGVDVSTSTADWAQYGASFEKDAEGNITFSNENPSTNDMSLIEAGASAEEVYKGDLNDQLVRGKRTFLVKDPQKSGQYWEGVTNNDAANSNQSEYVLDGIKNEPKKVYIWVDGKTDDGMVLGDDSTPWYFRYQDGDTLESYFGRLKEHGHSQVLVLDNYGKTQTVFYDGNEILGVFNSDPTKKTQNGMRPVKDVEEGTSTEWAKELNLSEAEKNASGTLGLLKNTYSWINELGTEAIITPQGTLTALPSRTGIIPADITKNLWELGDVAPSLLRILEGKVPGDKFGNSIFGGSTTDESFNVENIIMNVSADSSFDVDKFVRMVKSRVELTKNNSK